MWRGILSQKFKKIKTNIKNKFILHGGNPTLPVTSCYTTQSCRWYFFSAALSRVDDIFFHLHDWVV